MALGEEAGRLYGLPLEDFVAERDKAARAARQAGRKEAAAAISSLRKPTLAAWAVNQLARTNRRDVDLLLDSGKRLLDAQRESLEKGGRAGLDRARSSVDQAVARLQEAARVVLGERASETTLTRVADTLRAAAIQPEARQELATGTLVKEVTGTGWDVLAGLGAARPSASRRPEEERRQRQDVGAERRRSLQAELRAARKRRDDASRRLRRAERDERQAADALEEARERRELAERELAEAEREIALGEESLGEL
jgi:hypothetical protein